MKQYIYIDEQGDVGVGTSPPTGVDLDCMDNGILQVIVIEPYVHSNAGGEHAAAKIHEIRSDGKPVPLQPATIARDDAGNPYHYIPTK